MKNLFVLNTPYHLLTCFILAHSIYKKMKIILVLMHPHGYENGKQIKVNDIYINYKMWI